MGSDTSMSRMLTGKMGFLPNLLLLPCLPDYFLQLSIVLKHVVWCLCGCNHQEDSRIAFANWYLFISPRNKWLLYFVRQTSSSALRYTVLHFAALLPEVEKDASLRGAHQLLHVASRPSWGAATGGRIRGQFLAGPWEAEASELR